MEGVDDPTAKEKELIARLAGKESDVVDESNGSSGKVYYVCSECGTLVNAEDFHLYDRVVYRDGSSITICSDCLGMGETGVSNR